MSEIKPGPWVPKELKPGMSDAEFDAMVNDPEESARASVCDLDDTVEAMEVAEVAQKLDYCGHADVAARLVDAVTELAAAIKAARDVLGRSPYA